MRFGVASDVPVLYGIPYSKSFKNALFARF
jgi:hypothetical protein